MNKICSCLPNRRGARNRRGSGDGEPFLISVVPVISVVAGKISVVPGISMVVRVFRPVTAMKRRTKNELKN